MLPPCILPRRELSAQTTPLAWISITTTSYQKSFSKKHTCLPSFPPKFFIPRRCHQCAMTTWQPFPCKKKDFHHEKIYIQKCILYRESYLQWCCWGSWTNLSKKFMFVAGDDFVFVVHTFVLFGSNEKKKLNNEFGNAKNMVKASESSCLEVFPVLEKEKKTIWKLRKYFLRPFNNH